jgi:tRNA 2-thiouridine synthesizing protein C
LETDKTDLAVVFRHPPHGSASGREALDLTLAAASYELLTTTYFVQDGVYQLKRNQQPATIESKDYIVTFGALPLYDVEIIRVCEMSLKERGLTAGDLILDVEICSEVEIANYLEQTKQVLIF